LVGRLSGTQAPSSQNKINDEPHKNYSLIGNSAGRAPVFASFTLAFALQLTKKHGKTSVRVAEESG